MKYMGSKSRIAKQIVEVVREGNEGKVWVEPFVGGANIISAVDGERVGADSNEYIAAMWKELSAGWIPRGDYSRDEYNAIKASPDKHPRHVVGWVGICCSYCGKWFGGYAGEVVTKGGVRDYQKEAHRNVMKQVGKLRGVTFLHADYRDLEIPHNSVIYCDPPYADTTGYRDEFDHEAFWAWCSDMSLLGHAVYVSEYAAPDWVDCVWKKKLRSSLSANGKVGGSNKSTEKLFRVTSGGQP